MTSVESSSADAAIGIVVFLGLVVWIVGWVIFWIWAIVDLMRTPEHAFRLTGREKSNWVLIVVLATYIGAPIWRFSGARREVKAFAKANPYGPPVLGPPAGWYPDPTGRPGSSYWDGRAWTGHRQDLPP